MSRSGVVVAALVAAGAIGCTPHERPAATTVPTPTVTLHPVTLHPTTSAVSEYRQTTRALWQLHGATFTTGSRVASGRLLHVAEQVSMPLGSVEMRQVVLAFPAPTAHTACVRSAVLSLDAVNVEDAADAELGVYPSDEANYLASVRRPNSDLDLSRLIDNRPRGYLSAVHAGSLQIDVTDLYRVWASGGPFPSLGRTTDPRTPFVVVLRPPAAFPVAFDVTLATDPARSPVLRIEATRSCRR